MTSGTRQAISQSPTKKGKVQLDEFLEAELSQEPQVGFIIGVGANDVTGVLLPIATSLTYGLSSEKVMVTGAVSSSSSAGAQMEMAVQMTQQSAHEALTTDYVPRADLVLFVTSSDRPLSESERVFLEKPAPLWGVRRTVLHDGEDASVELRGRRCFVEFPGGRATLGRRAFGVHEKWRLRGLAFGLARLLNGGG